MSQIKVNDISILMDFRCVFTYAFMRDNKERITACLYDDSLFMVTYRHEICGKCIVFGFRGDGQVRISCHDICGDNDIYYDNDSNINIIAAKCAPCINA